MEYQYLISEERANILADDFVAKLKTNKGLSNFVGFAVATIKQRLAENPTKYREYGMYWPALKKVLNKYGSELGDDLIDDPIASIYGHYAREEAIIAASEDFRTFYNETFFTGTCIFEINQSNSISWTLYDADMEKTD